MGLAISRPQKSHDATMQAIITRAWHFLETGEFDIVCFLACTNHFQAIFDNDLLIVAEQEVDVFRDVEDHDKGRPIIFL